MKSKPIVSIDFEGVIHSYKSGWKGAAIIPDSPVSGAIDALLGYLDAGFEVAIFSSRSKGFAGRRAMKKWLSRAIAEHWERGGHSVSYAECECWGDAASLVNRFSWPWFKPSAIITIDDRALTFNGDWSHVAYSPAALRAFKPWNKRPDFDDYDNLLGEKDELFRLAVAVRLFLTADRSVPWLTLERMLNDLSHSLRDAVFSAADAAVAQCGRSRMAETSEAQAPGEA